MTRHDRPPLAQTRSISPPYRCRTCGAVNRRDPKHRAHVRKAPMTPHDCTRPPRCQEVAELYGQGRTLREVAQHCGVSITAVYQRLVRHAIPRRTQGGKGHVLDDLRDRR